MSAVDPRPRQTHAQAQLRKDTQLYCLTERGATSAVKQHYKDVFMQDPQRPRLICLPYAGGGPHIFQPWITSLKSRVELICPVLPGRGARIFETPLTSVEAVVDWLRRELEIELRGPVGIWGHSMGALLGYELCRSLVADGLPTPKHLFVSGRLPPHRPRRRDRYHLSADAELIARLTELGGTPAEVLGDHDLMSLLLPMVRADVTICETYEWRTDERPLDLPVTVIGGDADPEVPSADLSAWQDCTCGPVRNLDMRGGHFFLYENVDGLSALFADTLGAAQPRSALADLSA